ncbi:hypothetical protein ACFFSW_34005 [Saccharothrix longispora]|uniref:WXG100 family type VII secretion target n=1 Tax=Saccharothrix longispora TaxID=33920 RepID=A0ABU1Q3S8_9PSEU|nr:hypothetical protein [Saccharothrix longispora]MDR6597163.1 hypothetical protein [Saccharothrix longispora]
MAEENGLLGAVAGIGGAIGKAVGEVFAAEKRLSDTMASGPGSSQKFEVSERTVLEAGKIINTRVEELRERLYDAYGDLRISVSGMDKLNSDIAAAWNDRLVDSEDSYARRIEQYIDSLAGLVEQLRATAKQYGHTEEEVVAAMGAASASKQ